MIQLTISAGVILTALIMGSVLAIAGLIISFFSFALRKPPERKKSWGECIQGAINKFNINWNVQHPRAHFECPYDLQSCDHVDTSTMTLKIQCKDCPRGGNLIRPSKF